MASFQKSSYSDYEKYKLNKKKARRRGMDIRKKYIEDNYIKPCLFCGSEDDIQFHHINPLEKEKDVRSLYKSSYSIIDEEVKKCWCLCKECHSKLHRRLCDPLPSAYDT